MNILREENNEITTEKSIGLLKVLVFYWSCACFQLRVCNPSCWNNTFADHLRS